MSRFIKCSKKRFINDCKVIVDNFKNGNERLADIQTKTMEVFLDVKFRDDPECITAMQEVWKAEAEYHKNNQK